MSRLLNFISTIFILQFAFYVAKTRLSPKTMAKISEEIYSSIKNISRKNHSFENIKVFDNIIKSKNDNRQYQGLILNNGLKILLISDPSTEKSAASLDVNIGSSYDPINLQGLSHFLEHMLFLGTKKYLDPNDFSNFLSQYAGNNNAFTTFSNTLFYFDIDPKYLEPALDRFSQFFICPSFNSIYTDKELNAVHSEYEQYFDSDARKVFLVEKETCDLSHDYSKFTTGNKETLKTIPESKNINVREELLKFHSKYYSSNIMTFCVLGKESLEELYDMVVNRLDFFKIEDKNLTPKVYDKHYFQKEHLKKIIKVIPNKDLRELILNFPIPDYHIYYHSQPSHYVSHLIGHEGKGSILSELKANGLVDSLSTYVSSPAVGIENFIIKIELTKNGLENLNEIIKIIFQYLNLLKKVGPQKWIFDECKKIKEVNFDYKEKEKPRDTVTSVVRLMHKFPINEVLKNYYILDEYRPNIINELIEYLSPDNMRITIMAKKFENKTNRKEKYYGINYSIEDIPEDTIKEWKNAGFNEKLNLPLANEFIPEKLELVEREKEVLLKEEPILYQKDNFSRIWYLQDNEFNIPKTFVGMILKSPITTYNPVNKAAISIYVNLLIDSVNEYLYSANLAGLDFKINLSHDFILVEFSGYSEKINYIIDIVTDQLIKFNFGQKRFDLKKEVFYRNLKNFKNFSLISILNYLYSLFSCENNFSKEHIIDTYDEITYEKVQSIVQDYFKRFFIEIFIHGNVNKKDADLIIEKTKNKLIKHYNPTNVYPLSLLPKRHLKLENESYVYEKKSNFHNNNAIFDYFQFGLENNLDNIKLDLLYNIFYDRFYYNLRTEEQLGYIVYLQIKRSLGVQGLYFFIQSSQDLEYVDQKIDDFILKGKEFLNKMKEEDFEKYKESLRVLKNELPKNLISKSQEFWSKILKSTYQFNKREEELKVLTTINKNDIEEYYNDILIKNRKKLSFRVFGNKENSKRLEIKNAKIIKELIEFRNDLGSYPILKTYRKFD